MGALTRFHRDERGAVVVMIGAILALLLVFGVISIDLGLLTWTRSKLQNAADAASLAGVMELGDDNAVRDAAQLLGSANDPTHGMVVAPADVEIGNWNDGTKTFTPEGAPENAVRVTARRAAANANPLALTFGRVFGMDFRDVQAQAVATVTAGGGSTRFLIDDEVIDKDVPAIEELADLLNVDDPEDLIKDNDNDGWIDLPPGYELMLPTGQEGDEGLFDITHPEYPFSQSSTPYTHADFLRLKGDPAQSDFKDLLDPLYGVERVDDPSLYPSFVDPNAIHVSPVWKSDLSSGPNNPPWYISGLGERRGLLAFSILEVGPDPVGSELPSILILIRDPSDIVLEDIGVGSGGGAGGVRLVL